MLGRGQVQARHRYQVPIHPDSSALTLVSECVRCPGRVPLTSPGRPPSRPPAGRFARPLPVRGLLAIATRSASRCDHDRLQSHSRARDADAEIAVSQERQKRRLRITRRARLSGDRYLRLTD